MEAVKRTGKRIKTEHLDVRVAVSPLSQAGDVADLGARASAPRAGARVGVIVPKYKRTVVERNLLRRRLRELVRTRVLPVLPACDVIVRPFPRAYAATFDALAADIDRVVARLA